MDFLFLFSVVCILEVIVFFCNGYITGKKALSLLKSVEYCVRIFAINSADIRISSPLWASLIDH